MVLEGIDCTTKCNHVYSYLILNIENNIDAQSFAVYTDTDIILDRNTENLIFGYIKNYQGKSPGIISYTNNKAQAVGVLVASS